MELRFKPEKLSRWEKQRIQCQICIFPSVGHLVAYKTHGTLTMIRDESDRLLKSATVLLSSVTFVHSFVIFVEYRCCVLHRDSHTWPPTRSRRRHSAARASERHGTREFHRNYIGIRVLMHLNRVGDVHGSGRPILSGPEWTLWAVKLKIWTIFCFV